jgi:hypothetical protein
MALLVAQVFKQQILQYLQIQEHMVLEITAALVIPAQAAAVVALAQLVQMPLVLQAREQAE